MHSPVDVAPAGLAARLAGSAALVAPVTLVVSAIALVLFFGGASAVFGPINDLFVSATLMLLVPAVLVVPGLVSGRVGGWFGIVSLLAILGMTVAAVGQVLLVGGVITLATSFVTFGVGIVPFLAWVLGLAFVTIRRDVLSPAVGRWSLAFLGVAILASVASLFVPLDAAGLTLVLGVPVTAAIVGWLVVLGRALVRHA